MKTVCLNNIKINDNYVEAKYYLRKCNTEGVAGLPILTELGRKEIGGTMEVVFDVAD